VELELLDRRRIGRKTFVFRAPADVEERIRSFASDERA